MTSLRDIGSSLKMIEALSASFSTIKDLSGILSFPVLKELYLPYNQISDVQSIMFNETIEVLDLEGNEIEKSQCIDDLQTLKSLRYLTLLWNPIEKNEEEFKELVIEKLPKLEILDDIPTTQLKL